ncbi:hypothetical protein LTR40_011854, partial [Exophiala xenobiotica]
MQLSLFLIAASVSDGLSRFRRQVERFGISSSIWLLTMNSRAERYAYRWLAKLLRRRQEVTGVPVTAGIRIVDPVTGKDENTQLPLGIETFGSIKRAIPPVSGGCHLWQTRSVKSKTESYTLTAAQQAALETGNDWLRFVVLRTHGKLVAMRQFRVDMREWQMTLVETEWRRGNRMIFRPQFRREPDIALGWRFITRENEREFLPTNQGGFPDAYEG